MTKRKIKVLKHYVSVWDVSLGLLSPRMHGQSYKVFSAGLRRYAFLFV